MKALLVLALIFISLSCYSQDIIWQDSTHYDFGDLKLNNSATHDFIFLNNSKQNIFVETVRTTCTCTDTEWTGSAVLPGKQGKVRAIFNSHDLGYFNKKLKVYFKDIKGAIILRVEGNVE
ncbi:MAG TPA: DUF1573 domain-containing protein [Saprospiraceae bacterium]|nr:DUF1573 domain-containing protein [Saprospiraceae bacterium]